MLVNIFDCGGKRKEERSFRVNRSRLDGGGQHKNVLESEGVGCCWLVIVEVGVKEGKKPD